MKKRNMDSGKKLVSRRQFLVGSSAFMAAVALAACATKTTTPTTNVTTTATQTTPVSPTATSTTPQPTATSTPKYGGTLRLILGSVGSSSVGWPADSTHLASAQECLETLLRGDSKGNVVPWLAESYQVADNLKSITFKLRQGVKFHDGSEFNAAVAKWNLDNMIEAKLNPSWGSVDIIDDNTIQVNITEWMNTVLTTFGDTSGGSAHMISKEAFDKNGLNWVRQNPVGTGPFKFVSYALDVGMKFVRNTDYWVKGKPYLDGTEDLFISDSMTQKMAIQTNEADMVYPIHAGKATADYAAMGMTVKTVMDGTNVLVPDTAHPGSPWANQKVREAVEYAIDREAIAKGLGYGFWQAPYQMPPRGSLAYDPGFTSGRKYDLEKAKQLLGDAGYSSGFNTNIISFPNPDMKDVLIAVQGDLAKVGIQVNLDFPNFGKFSTYMGSGTWPEGNVLASPVPMTNQYYSGGLNFIFGTIGQSWLRTPELTQAYQTASASPAPDIKLIRAVTDIITRDALLVPINENGSARADKPYVVADFNQRGFTTYWNSEDAWLNK